MSKKSNTRLDPQPSSPERTRPAQESYWKRRVRLTTGLLAVWAIAGFGMSILGVEALNEVTFNGMPFGFWMAQQGAILVFVLLILAYAMLSQRADQSG